MRLLEYEGNEHECFVTELQDGHKPFQTVFEWIKRHDKYSLHKVTLLSHVGEQYEFSVSGQH
jgi:hypothetical protein